MSVGSEKSKVIRATLTNTAVGWRKADMALEAHARQGDANRLSREGRLIEGRLIEELEEAKAKAFEAIDELIAAHPQARGGAGDKGAPLP